MARELTDKQRLFLELLFAEGINGDFVKAKVAAGYSPEYATSSLLASLKEEVIEATKDYIARSGPRAAVAIVGAIDRPTELGVREKLKAAMDVLDRVGIVKTEKVEVSSNGLFILPRKDEENDGD